LEPLGDEQLELAVPRFLQPDDVTCGPTCLLQVLRYYGDDIPFDRLLALTPRNPDGGTLAVYLGLTARRLGYHVQVTCWNLRVFDPTWEGLSPPALREKLVARAGAVSKPKLRAACEAYARLLAEGGQVVLLPEPTVHLLTAPLRRGHPVVCGLNATYLYRLMRERADDQEDDDVAGDPVGHFVVACGYRPEAEQVVLCDPARHIPPPTTEGRTLVPARRFMDAILLGIVSYDAVLLEIWPPDRGVE